MSDEEWLARLDLADALHRATCARGELLSAAAHDACFSLLGKLLDEAEMLAGDVVNLPCPDDVRAAAKALLAWIPRERGRVAQMQEEIAGGDVLLGASCGRDDPVPAAPAGVTRAQLL